MDTGDRPKKSLLKRFVDWWLTPATTRAANVLLGFVACAFFALAAAVVAVGLEAVEIVDLGGAWDAWVVAVALAIALLLGVSLGALITRAVYRPDRFIREWIEAAANHLLLLLQQGIGTTQFDIGREVLPALAKMLKRSVPADICVSLWEPDGQGGNASWKLVYSPNNTHEESQALSETPLSQSWIAKMSAMTGDSPFYIEDLAQDSQPGKDLEVLSKFGNRSLMCARTRLLEQNDPQEAVPCLVVTSKEPRAFTRIEQRYLQLLGHILSLHEHVLDLKKALEQEGAV
jgi:hypothetical protein